MAKDNTKYLILGGVLIAAVYLVTRRQATQAPAPQVAQQQLLNWAQSQPSNSAWTSLISNMSIDDVLGLWDRIFGKKEEESSYQPAYSSDWDQWV